MCRISIVVPVYNGEKYIKNTISPFLSCREDIELIFVNDESTDNTLTVLNEIKADNPQLPICIYTQGKAGVSVARNKGIELATGEYIYFCDADDLVDDSLIGKACKYIQDECDMVVWEHNILRSSGIQHLEYKPIACDNNDVVHSNLDVLKGLLDDDFRLCMGTFLFKKSLLSDNNIQFTMDCRYGEDLEFMFKLILAADKIACIPEELFTYVRHNDSSMGTYNVRRFDAPKMVLRFLDYINNSKEEKILDIARYVENEYFAKQYCYSLIACVSQLKVRRYLSFWKEVEQLYPGLREKAQRALRQTTYDKVNFNKKRFVVARNSIKMFSLVMMLRNSLKN